MLSVEYPNIKLDTKVEIRSPRSSANILHMELKASIDEGKDTQNPAYSEGDHEDSSGPPEGRKKEAINNDVGITELTTQEPDDHAGHQELRDSTSSPRKKRSRDQFDADADREQKIMATEEARAHRRSAEIDRVGDPDSTGTKVVLSEAHTDAQLTPRPTYEALRSPSVDAERTMVCENESCFLLLAA